MVLGGTVTQLTLTQEIGGSIPSEPTKLVLSVNGSTMVSKTIREGSSPSGPAIYIGMYISWLDSHPDKVEVVGSSPTIPTVIVAQLVEQWVVVPLVVVPLVVGSNPI